MAGDAPQPDERAQPKPPHERSDLYEDDLTDERGPTPAELDEVAHTEVLDPQIDDDEPDAPYGDIAPG